MAAFVLCVIVGVIRAGFTGLAIENGSIKWAVNALSLFHTVYLIERAAEALFTIEIEVFREVAFYATVSSPEGGLWALALPRWV